MIPNTDYTPDDEIDLLDLLVVIAENIKLLILGPLSIGILALGITFTLPKTYESLSTLSPNKPGTNVSGPILVSYIKSADTLEAIAKDIDFEPGHSLEKRLKKLEKSISVSVGKADGLVTLKTQAHTPEMAQALNTAVWKHVLPLTIPRNSDMQRLQAQLQSEKARLASSEQLEKETAVLLSNEQGHTEATPRLFGELLNANSERLKAISVLEAQMEGLTIENFSQRPTLPESSIKPRKGLIAAAATVGTGLILLLFIFGRYALSNSKNDPEQAEKIQRLRQAFGLKS